MMSTLAVYSIYQLS